MRPDEIDDLLRGEAELAWRPQLTAAVMAGIRREKAGTRWRVAAAAALVLLTAGLGGLALSTGLEVTGVGGEIAARAPTTDLLREAIGRAWSLGAGLVETALAPLDHVPHGPGLPLAVAALALLLIVNGLTLGRPALARRRNS